MYLDFSKTANEILDGAMEEFGMGDRELEPVDILASLAKRSKAIGSAYLAFRELGLNSDSLHNRIMALGQDRTVSERPNGYVNKILNYAREESARRRGDKVESIDLLLGLLRCGNGLVSQVLSDEKITYESAREKLKGFYTK